MMNDKNIDELFRDKLKDFEKTPPAYLFDNVMAGMAGMRRKRRLMYWRIASVAAALLVAFVAGWQISDFNSRAEKQSVVLNPNKAEQTPQQDLHGQQSETLSADNAQAAQKADNTSAARAVNNRPSATHPAGSSSRKNMEQETLVRTEDFEQVALLKTRSARIEKKDPSPPVLQEKKVEKPAEDLALRSIDQQIMEQNQLAMAARDEKQRKNRWTVGALVSPAVNVNRSSHSSQYASTMLNASNPAVDLGGGLSVEYKPAKRWSVQSGVYYAGIAQSSGNINTFRGEYADAGNVGMDYFNAPVNIVSDKMMMNSTAGVIELKNIPSEMVVGTNLEDKSLSTAVVVSDAKFIQDFQYLEIPLYLRYTLLDKRFDIELLGGVSSNVLVGNNTYLDSNTGKSLIGKTQDMQDMSYSSTLGLGLKYGLSKRVHLNLEPRVKYYLNSLNNNPQVEYKPYTIGVFTGISYSF